MKTIVFAEDNLVTLTAYKLCLELAGFKVKTARDGVVAMRIMSQTVPDLVILDLEMPKFNGGEVLEYIRTSEHLKAVPVVILSTNTIVDVAREHFLNHANRRLLKGNCNSQVLLRTIQELLGPDKKDKTTPADPVENNFLNELHNAR
ncbi:MAG TPA: response regulator [Verrucomicrobiae bacterium]|nr:response regulator [Verrucomicrobiae bacterium]